jgi:hypothetical protein
MRCERHGLLFQNGERVESHVCIGVLDERFVKLRMTQLPAPDHQDSVVAAFGAAIMAALDRP